MLKKIRHFFREYKQFGFVVLTILVALGLDIGGLDTAAHWVLAIVAIINVFPIVWGMIEDVRTGK